MKIIIDSNILFSALIKDSLTRRMILEYNGYFLFPYFIFEEMEKHKGELLKKSKMSGYWSVFRSSCLFSRSILINVEEIKILVIRRELQTADLYQ